FIALGLPVLQGYGLTEAAPIVSANREADNDPVSVGRPLSGVEVKLADDDELLVKSPGVMAGYWQRDEDTASTIDAHGWLHTGDQARIVDGRLYITGRIKEIIVLSTGEKTAPGDVETALCRDPLIDQALVVGEAKPYLGALLVLDRERWHDVAAALALTADAPASLRDERATAHVVTLCDAQLGEFPAYARVRRVWLSLEPWTIENGLATPTLKLKRASVQQHCADSIAAIYAGHSIPEVKPRAHGSAGTRSC
ncbi:MAG: AMP-binding protein, partial [Gammaproteobacteria bacterium]